MLSSGSVSKSRQKGSPCVHCRQMKVKCDVNETFPAPCSRCGRSGKKCFVDPSFRRTPKKDRLGNIEKELRDLRERHDAHGTPKDAERESRSSFAGTFSSHSPTGNVLDELSLVSLIAQLRDLNTIFPSKSIDGIEVDRFMFADLLEIFYSHHHFRFPLLQDPGAPIKFYNTCPLLFWVVVEVAAKKSQKYAHLHEMLREPVTRLAAEHTKPTSRSISFVQALLLLSAWPFPYRKLREDPSWLYCGLACHMAMLLGLHRPAHPSQFMTEEDDEVPDMDVRARTWLCCFIADQNTSTKYGVPATLNKSDNTILRALSIPISEATDSLSAYLQLAHISSRYATLLGQYESESTGLLPDPLPAVRMLDTELGIFQTRNASTWSDAVEITFLGARLNLYSYLLAESSAPEKRQADVDTEFVPLSYMAATRLLRIACASPIEMAQGTLHVRFCVLYATLFVLRLSRTSHRQLIDEVAAKNTISQAWGMLRDASDAEGDHLIRACAIIEYVSKADWSKESALPTRSRMGSNFIVDVLLLAKTRHKKESPASSNPVDEFDINKDFLAQFPAWDGYDLGGQDPAMLGAEFNALFGAYGFA